MRERDKRGEREERQKGEGGKRKERGQRETGEREEGGEREERLRSFLPQIEKCPTHTHPNFLSLIRDARR